MKTLNNRQRKILLIIGIWFIVAGGKISFIDGRWLELMGQYMFPSIIVFSMGIFIVSFIIVEKIKQRKNPPR